MGLLRALIETKFLTIVHRAVFPGDAKHPLDEKLAAQGPLHSERDSSFPPWILVPILGTVLLHFPHSVGTTVFQSCGMFYLLACNPTGHSPAKA